MHVIAGRFDTKTPRAPLAHDYDKDTSAPPELSTQNLYHRFGTKLIRANSFLPLHPTNALGSLYWQWSYKEVRCNGDHLVSESVILTCGNEGIDKRSRRDRSQYVFPD